MSLLRLASALALASTTLFTSTSALPAASPLDLVERDGSADASAGNLYLDDFYITNGVTSKAFLILDYTSQNDSQATCEFKAAGPSQTTSPFQFNKTRTCTPDSYLFAITAWTSSTNFNLTISHNIISASTGQHITKTATVPILCTSSQCDYTADAQPQGYPVVYSPTPAYQYNYVNGGN